MQDLQSEVPGTKYYKHSTWNQVKKVFKTCKSDAFWIQQKFSWQQVIGRKYKYQSVKTKQQVALLSQRGRTMFRISQ